MRIIKEQSVIKERALPEPFKIKILEMKDRRNGYQITYEPSSYVISLHNLIRYDAGFFKEEDLRNKKQRFVQVS